MHLSDTSSIAQYLKKTSVLNNRIKKKYYRKHNIILELQNNKQKPQILEVLQIRNIQPKLIRINFETSANVLKCL